MGLESFFELFKERLCATACGCLEDSLFILEMRHVTDAHILFELQLILIEVLKHDAKAREECIAIPIFQVFPIEKNAPFDGIVEARDELDERCFPSTVLSNDRDALL